MNKKLYINREGMSEKQQSDSDYFIVEDSTIINDLLDKEYIYETFEPSNYAINDQKI